jgi:hypothetical protein
MSYTPKVTHALIPNLLHCEHCERRAAHLDIADLSAERAWAESAMLTHWLATAIFEQFPPKRFIPTHGSGGYDYTDHDWVRERLKRLRAVVAGRRVAA